MAYSFLYYKPTFYLVTNQAYNSPRVITSNYTPVIRCTDGSSFTTLYNSFTTATGTARNVLSRIETVTGLSFNSCILPCSVTTEEQYSQIVSVGEFAPYKISVSLTNIGTTEYQIFVGSENYWTPTLNKPTSSYFFQPSVGGSYTKFTDNSLAGGCTYAHGTSNIGSEARLMLYLPVVLMPITNVTAFFYYEITLLPGENSFVRRSNTQYTSSAALQFYNAMTPTEPDSPTDPYEPVGPSEPSFPSGGTFNNDSDSYPISSLPSFSIADTGFTRVYTPTLTQIKNLAKYLWTDGSLPSTFINHIRQYFENPMDAFIGFNIIPATIPFSRTEPFAVMLLQTGISMNVADSQFIRVDCGTVTIEEQYGSAIDYSPYTKISAFLPYIGMVDLDTDEVMGRTLQLIYNIDIVTGSCVAHILVSGADLYQFTGNCAINIPFSQADFSNYVSALISIAKLAVEAKAGAAYAGVASTTHTNYSNSDESSGSREMFNVNTGTRGPFQVEPTTRKIKSEYSGNSKSAGSSLRSTTHNYRGLTPGQISNTVGQVMSSKPTIVHSGALNGNAGCIGNRRPMILKRYPRLCNPAQYGVYNGRPSLSYLSLGSCSGFTQVQQCRLENISAYSASGTFYATNNEVDEIQSLLKGGVVF